MDSGVGRPRVRAPAAVHLRREHLLSEARHARVFGKSDRERAVRRSDPVDHRQPGPRAECGLVAVLRAVRGGRVRPRPAYRHDRRRRRARGHRLRLLAAAFPQVQPDAFDGRPMDPVRTRFAAPVSRQWQAARPPSRDGVHDVADSVERTRRCISDPGNTPARRVPARARPADTTRAATARLRARRSAAPHAGRARPVALSPRTGGRSRVTPRARRMGHADRKLSRIADAGGRVPAVAPDETPHQRSGRRVVVSRRAAGAAGARRGDCRPYHARARTASLPINQL